MKKSEYHYGIALSIVLIVVGLCMMIITLMNIELPKYVSLIAAIINFIAAFLILFLKKKD